MSDIISALSMLFKQPQQDPAQIDPQKMLSISSMLANAFSKVNPKPQAPTDDTDLLARTAWGEARGEGPQGIEAVMHVIMNRMAQKKPGSSISDVVLDPKQFSVWNEGNINLDKMKAVGDEDLAKVREVAARVLGGESEDTTGGATHYFSTNMETPPAWASRMKPTTKVGRHVFYK